MNRVQNHLAYAQYLEQDATQNLPAEPSFGYAVKLLYALLHATLVVAEQLDMFSQLVGWEGEDEQT